MSLVDHNSPNPSFLKRGTLPLKLRGSWRGLLLLLSFLIIILWYDQVIAPSSPSPRPNASGGQAGDGEGWGEVEIVPTTTILAVGDIMLSRNVGAKIEKAQDPNLPFAKLSSILKDADITFGNLECPLDPGKNRIREGLIFRCITADAEGLVSSGFDVLSTANNHSFDQGSDNIDFTIDYLRSQGIIPVGTTSSLSPPREGEMKEGVIERNGIHFGFLAYSYSARNDGRNTTDPQIATMDISQMQKDVAALKSQAEVIIVSMHAGTEYTRHPNQKQIDFAHAAIDAGADIVLGHHPHWIQAIEEYSPTLQLSPDEERVPERNEGREVKGEGKRKGIIFYSLGNFVFDQMWSQETREGLMVRFEFQGRELLSYELIPIIIDNYCCPRLADEKEKQKILGKFDNNTK